MFLQLCNLTFPILMTISISRFLDVVFQLLIVIEKGFFFLHGPGHYFMFTDIPFKHVLDFIYTFQWAQRFHKRCPGTNNPYVQHIMQSIKLF